MTTNSGGDHHGDERINTVSLEEFNALVEQTRQLQVRLDELELQQKTDEEDEPTSIATLKQSNQGDNHHLIGPRKSKNRRRSSGLTESMVEELYDTFELPPDTYTLLMTQPIYSIPFLAGFIAPLLAASCLILAFINELDQKSYGNPFGVPAGVRSPVRAAQFLGVIVGILMESEIPTGLTIIGKGAEQKDDENGMQWGRLVVTSLLRMTIGYLFICCLFLTVVQEDTVLDIFFDVLALEFVESIDDILYNLFKRGFFGRQLRVATNNTYYIHCSKKEHERKIRHRFKLFIRLVYFVNMLVGMALLTNLTLKQRRGVYRCNSVMIDFGDASWEQAKAVWRGQVEDRMLIYSHFNGIYEEEGRYDGRPRYVERNKEDGDPFREIVPAEIVYCQPIEAWVFRHPDITTLTGEKNIENECGWLLRSPSTESYDLIQLADEKEWDIWMSIVENDYKVRIACNECQADSDCNYKGLCVPSKTYGYEGRCKCDSNFFGIFCQFEQPCNVIRSEKDRNTTLQLLPDYNDEEGEDFVEVYGRPMYYSENMSGKPYNLLRLGYPENGNEYFNISYPIGSTGVLEPHKHYHDAFFTDDDFFEINNTTEAYQDLLKNYTFVLRFTGQRWYGQIVPPGLTAEKFKEEEYHAFWLNAFTGPGNQDNTTLLISSPAASSGSPVGSDFFEMRRRNGVFEEGEFDYNYGPFGVLIPLTGYEGSGWFHCNIDNN